MVSNELINKAKEFHGHICPFLVLGLRMSEIAMKKLEISKAGVVESIREDLIAIVEVNNCLVDGVQIATGCTFGNNSLIYIDLGKNAVTLIRRRDRVGVRIYVDADKIRTKYFSDEALKLFHKVVVEKKGSEHEIEKLHKLWEEIGYKMANLPEEEFNIQEIEIVEEIERAPIFKNSRCSKCGELVMETRVVRLENDIVLCYRCMGMEVNAVIGRGIEKLKLVPYRIIKTL